MRTSHAMSLAFRIGEVAALGVSGNAPDLRCDAPWADETPNGEPGLHILHLLEAIFGNEAVNGWMAQPDPDDAEQMLTEGDAIDLLNLAFLDGFKSVADKLPTHPQK